MNWIAVAAGGALGSLVRFGVSVAVERIAGRPHPWATAAVNVIGCVCVGMLAGALSAQRLEMSNAARAFVLVGLFGGFTTFSSFGLDTLRLVQEGRHAAAAVNVVLQVSLGLLGVFAGYAVAVRAL